MFLSAVINRIFLVKDLAVVHGLDKLLDLAGQAVKL